LEPELVTIDAPPEDHDAILLNRVAAWAAAGPVSFLRVNKPTWRLEVTRHGSTALDADAADAVADSALVLHLLAAESEHRVGRSRRELVLRSMRRVAEALALTRDERRTLHREGYSWPIALGRWDDDAMAALERRFLNLRDRMDALLAAPCDPAIEARWALLARSPAGPGTAIDRARRAMDHHANRLGVFAEAEAILHYFLFRLDSVPEQA